MISINIKYMIKEQENLLESQRQMQLLMETAQESIKKLHNQNMGGEGEIFDKLGRYLEEMEEEIKGFQGMEKGLSYSVHQYFYREEKILDSLEEFQNSSQSSDLELVGIDVPVWLGELFDERGSL